MATIKSFIKKHAVLTFYLLAFAISWGGILILVGPGGYPSPEQVEPQSPLFLLVMLAWFAGPSVTSILLTGLLYGRAGFRELLSRLLRWQVAAVWYAVALLTAPLLYAAVSFTLSLFSPEFLPNILTTGDKAALVVMGIAYGLIGGGFLEELGWTGFAVPRLRLQYSSLTTGLIAGVLWGAYHFSVMYWASSPSGVLPLAILLAQLFAWMPAFRVLMVWVYDRTESLLIAMLMHASLSAGMFILMPMTITGIPLLAWLLVWAAALWLVVAVVAVTSREHLSQRPLRTRAASRLVWTGAKSQVQNTRRRSAMVYTKLSTVVKAVRLHYAVPFVVLLVAIYLVGIHPWMINWGSTAAEQQMTLPGDDLNPNRTGQSTQAITINAPSAVVWQWLVQVGQDRAGFYSYTWLENLIGVNIHNANEIHPEWQQLAVGDSWRLAPPDYLWGLGKDAATPVLISEPGHALVLDMWGAWVIEPIDEHTSRLLVRSQSGASNLVTKMVLDPMVFTMARRMLLGLKARAEGHPEAPAALMAIAQLGWAAAGVTVAGLFLSQRRRLYWLLLPVVAALPALLTSGDVQAGLAAFLAVSITVLGFLFFGKSWWGSFLIVGSVVLLTLLLAPDAYIAIGLAFTLLLLVAVGAMVAGHSGTLNRGEGRLTTPAR